MKKSVYNNKPISEQDLTDYICTEYKAVKGVWTITDVKDTVGITEPLLQIELGDEDDNDCTLVAFTSVIRQFIADSTIAAKVWNLPGPGTELVSPALAAGFLVHCITREVQKNISSIQGRPNKTQIRCSGLQFL